MPPKKSVSKSAKKAPTARATKAAATAAARQAKREAENEALRQWIAQNDPLLDKAETNPIKLDDIFNRIVTRKTFAQPSMGQVPYDWSAFRAAVESRSAQSPRWFVQLREEDLLAGADGMEGVTVNCFVVAETAEPTLAPSEYVVKVHWPYSDAEDNAPERILLIADQGMCWRRVVKNDGSDVNMYLLQKRSDGVAAAAAASSSSPFPAASSGAPTAASFGFGAAPAPTATTTTTATGAAAPPSSVSTGGTAFGFGFGSTTTTTGGNTNPAAAPASGTPAVFGFGFNQQPPTAGATAAPVAPASFGFGAATGPIVPLGTSSPSAAPATFGFGSAAPAASGASAAAPATAAPPVSSPGNNEDGTVKTQPLKTSEVLFALWSRKRLTSMAHEVKSGGRIVRENFPLDNGSGRTVKLVMENDRKDSVEGTVRRLILNRLFAKQDNDVMEMDKWIADCPVYDEHLTTALQAFRERNLDEIADESEEFAKLYDAYHGKMEAELQRIVDVRAKAAQVELDRIESISECIKEHKLAEKSAFRLLKYYPKNDVQKFRPFGKVSGISEMGEAVDFCEPPAHVNINPFTGKPS